MNTQPLPLLRRAQNLSWLDILTPFRLGESSSASTPKCIQSLQSLAGRVGGVAFAPTPSDELLENPQAFVCGTLGDYTSMLYYLAMDYIPEDALKGEKAQLLNQLWLERRQSSDSPVSLSREENREKGTLPPFLLDGNVVPVNCLTEELIATLYSVGALLLAYGLHDLEAISQEQQSFGRNLSRVTLEDVLDTSVKTFSAAVNPVTSSNVKSAYKKMSTATDVMEEAMSLFYDVPDLSSTHAVLQGFLRCAIPTLRIGVACTKYLFALVSEVVSNASTKQSILAKKAFQCAICEVPACCLEGVKQLRFVMLAAAHRHAAEAEYTKSRVPDMALTMGYIESASDLLDDVTKNMDKSKECMWTVLSFFPLFPQLVKEVQTMLEKYDKENRLIYHAKPISGEKLPDIVPTSLEDETVDPIVVRKSQRASQRLLAGESGNGAPGTTPGPTTPSKDAGSRFSVPANTHFKNTFRKVLHTKDEIEELLEKYVDAREHSHKLTAELQCSILPELWDLVSRLDGASDTFIQVSPGDRRLADSFRQLWDHPFITTYVMSNRNLQSFLKEVFLPQTKERMGLWTAQLHAIKTLQDVLSQKEVKVKISDCVAKLGALIEEWDTSLGKSVEAFSSELSKIELHVDRSVGKEMPSKKGANSRSSFAPEDVGNDSSAAAFNAWRDIVLSRNAPSAMKRSALLSGCCKDTRELAETVKVTLAEARMTAARSAGSKGSRREAKLKEEEEELRKLAEFSKHTILEGKQLLSTIMNVGASNQAVSKRDDQQRVQELEKLCDLLSRANCLLTRLLTWQKEIEECASEARLVEDQYQSCLAVLPKATEDPGTFQASNVPKGKRSKAKKPKRGRLVEEEEGEREEEITSEVSSTCEPAHSVRRQENIPAASSSSAKKESPAKVPVAHGSSTLLSRLKQMKKGQSEPEPEEKSTPTLRGGKKKSRNY